MDKRQEVAGNTAATRWALLQHDLQARGVRQAVLRERIDDGPLERDRHVGEAGVIGHEERHRRSAARWVALQIGREEQRRVRSRVERADADRDP